MSVKKKQNRYLEAAQMYEKSAEAEQMSFSPRLADLSAELNEAGYFYNQMGQHNKAIDHYQ